jgi:cytochrome c oxidase assembly factor CtaG
VVAAVGALQMIDFTGFMAVFFLFFLVIIVLIVVGAARAFSSRGRIQRPLSESTAFPPPPPPDTVMVKCNYCGTEQKWSEKCVQCGAPLPKPQLP